MIHLLCDDDWPSRLAALDASRGASVLVTGEDPLQREDLFTLLAAMDDRDLRAILHTDGTGLDDDRAVRPFAPFDVRFRVRLPSLQPERYRTLTGHDLEATRFGLRNLQAFAYPVEPEIPVSPETLPDLVETIAEALSGGVYRGVRLRAEQPDRSLLDGLSEVLLELDRRGHRPHPRVLLDGIPVLALPVDQLTDVDVRTDEPADVPFPDHVTDPDVRARRRVWLTTAPLDRPARRGHPLDRFDEAVSLVRLRGRHGVYAVLDRLRDDRPVLARTDRVGLSIAGRFDDPLLADRFATLCRTVHAAVQQDPPVDLAGLRVLAHVLRRSMKPKHDDEPIQMRGEGG